MSRSHNKLYIYIYIYIFRYKYMNILKGGGGGGGGGGGVGSACFFVKLDFGPILQNHLDMLKTML